jgi:carbon storage regulator
VWLLPWHGGNLLEGLAMLVLTRRPEEVIQIGSEIEIKVVAVQGNRVRLAINAPDHVIIRRAEISDATPGEAARAASLAGS